MRHFFKSRVFSFSNAFSGLFYVVRTQKNSWIHALATIIVIITAAILRVDPIEWVLLSIAIGIVWITETINTSIELVIDLITQERNSYAKHAKDAGAAAVLISALVAVIVGLVVFVPYLFP